MAGVFSQLELAMIRARVRSGMENARAKGVSIGRPQVTKEDIPASFLRYYATILAESGISPGYVQEMLGHSKLEFTLKYYTHITGHMADMARLAIYEKLTSIVK